MLWPNVISFRYEMRFNMKTGAASQKQLSVSAVDFPRINESYTGRYFYWRFQLQHKFPSFYDGHITKAVLAAHELTCI